MTNGLRLRPSVWAAVAVIGLILGGGDIARGEVDPSPAPAEAPSARAVILAPALAAPRSNPAASQLRAIYTEALVHGTAYEPTTMCRTPVRRCSHPAIPRSPPSPSRTAYAAAVRAAPGRHLFAVETDNGGFQPRGFSVGSTQGDAAGRAAKWLPLFEPYGITFFRAGAAGADVSPLLLQGVTVAELTPDSQRYFDLHHTRRDGLDQVNPRELELVAAALASLLWLVDTQGL